MIEMRLITTMSSGQVHTGVWGSTDLPSAQAWLDNPEAQVSFIGDLIRGPVIRAEVEAKIRRGDGGPLRMEPPRTLFLLTSQIEDVEVQIREMRTGETTTVVEPEDLNLGTPTDEPSEDVLG